MESDRDKAMEAKVGRFAKPKAMAADRTFRREARAKRSTMRLSIFAATVALIACPVDAQIPDASPMPPRPMRNSPPPPPPLTPPPATLGDADAACQRGDQPACEEASKIRARILSGGALVPPPASEGGLTPAPADPGKP